MENEGLLVIKVYQIKHKNFTEDLEKYKNELKRIQSTFDLMTHPNVMPYQRLILDDVNTTIKNREKHY